VKHFDITIRVKILRGDIDEHIAGIKEDAAASIEARGAGIIGITVKEIRPQQPKQLSFKDTLPPPTSPPPLTRPRGRTAPKPAFTPPAHEEAIMYCMERGLNKTQAEQWYDDKVRGGWTWGRDTLHPLQDWKADVRTRERQLREDGQIFQGETMGCVIETARQWRERTLERYAAMSDAELANHWFLSQQKGRKADLNEASREIVRRCPACEDVTKFVSNHATILPKK